MILEVIKYGNPVLRKKGVKIEKITPEIKTLIADMFETMYAAKGIGLAAQQVSQALQLTVLDIRGITDRPSTLELNGKETDPEKIMPLVLINPEVKPFGDTVSAPEGCLSFPEIYNDITRPEKLEVRALTEKGETLEFKCGGLLSRAIQHENDHLNGVLFIDRMPRADKEELKDELDELQQKTKAASKK